MRTPPSTSGTPTRNACASTPNPTRSSDTIERVRKIDEPVEGQPGDCRLGTRSVEQRPRATPDENGDHAGGRSRDDVVVHAVTDVGDPRRADSRHLGHAVEEER